MLNPVTIIKKKRDGGKLSKEEIELFIKGFTDGYVPDYQMSAFLMAVYFSGMDSKETGFLTQSMLHSGAKVDLSQVKVPKIDKHSTGGVGDKPSLILAPLLSCLGVAVPMISGRGLGHTGGTSDKLEAIPGFKTELTNERFQELVKTMGVAMISQSKEIAPADRRMYALRDVTATVDCIPLIVGSIMSKKLAEDFDGLVLDVKTGNGAFMKDPKGARELAKALAATGRHAGKHVRVLITDMSQPLGYTAGNSIEVNECTAFLRQGPKDAKPEPRLYEVTIALAVEMLLMARNVAKKPLAAAEARKLVVQALQSGRAYGKYLELISMQGGNTAIVDEGLPLAPILTEWKSSRAGYVTAMDTESIGMALVELGGGRKRAEDKIDHGVGIHFAKHLGAPVKKGELIAKIYSTSESSGKQALQSLQTAIVIAGKKAKVPKLIRERI